MFVPMPERSGLPVPHAREHVPGQEETTAVMFILPALAWARRSLMEEKEHESFAIVLSSVSARYRRKQGNTAVRSG